MTFRWDPLPTNNPFEDRFQRTIYASQLFFDSLQSKNYVAGASGFRIDVDGTAEFASGITLGPGTVTIASDIVSANWAGGDPETGSSVGYKLDYSTGNTQFGGNMYIKASLDVDGNTTVGGTITANGAITTNATITANNLIDLAGSGNGSLQTDSSVPYVLIHEPGAVGGEVAMVRNAGDTTDPALYADDTQLYIGGRVTSGGDANERAQVRVFSEDGTADQTHSIRAGKSSTAGNTTLMRIDMHSPGSYEDGAMQFDVGDAFDVTAMGSVSRPQFFFYGRGGSDAQSTQGASGYVFSAFPATTAFHTQWWNGNSAVVELNSDDQWAFDYGTSSKPGITFYNDEDTGLYRYGSNVIGFTAGANNRVAIHSDGFAVEDNDRALPHWAHFTESDGSPASASTWTQIGSNRIAWDHNGTNRAVRVAIHFACFAQNTGATNRIMAMRIRYSLDGGSTWTAAGEQHTVAGSAAGGAQRQAMSKTVIVSGTCTGDLLVQFQAWRDGTITGNFRNISYSTQTLGLL